MREIVLTHDQFDSLSQAVIEAGGCLRFEAHGSSMHPLLKNNDVITVRAADNCELTPGAIVLCRTAHNRLIVHRIVKNRGDSPDDSLLLIRGDTNPGGEELVGRDSVIGIISRVERGAKAFRVDRGPWHRLGRVVARYRNLVPRIMAPWKLLRRSAGRILRHVQSQGAYRKVLNRILAHRVRYDVHADGSRSSESGQISNLLLLQRLCLPTLTTQSQAHFAECYTISAIVGKREAGSVKVFHRLVRSEEHSEGWWLVDLRVWYPFRGSGIGEQLVRRATELVLDEGVNRLNVLVNRSNRPALSLYRKLGFQLAPEPLHAAIMDAMFPERDTSFTVLSLSVGHFQAEH